MYATIAHRSATGTCAAYEGIAPKPFVMTSKKCPVGAARTEKGLFEASGKRAERWARVARETSQQSRRVRVPAVLRPYLGGRELL